MWETRQCLNYGRIKRDEGFIPEVLFGRLTVIKVMGASQADCHGGKSNVYVLQGSQKGRNTLEDEGNDVDECERQVVTRRRVTKPGQHPGQEGPEENWVIIGDVICLQGAAQEFINILWVTKEMYILTLIDLIHQEEEGDIEVIH